ncbi:MAG TPA: hypothetical protein VD789_02320 [Thermomicrobiales bacterium]|nr:hypothetical protein [Thermomicrobiales bacterium]
MVTPAERNTLFELLHRDHYSPDELARLLGMDLHLILHDAQWGRLRAYIVDHHVLDIRREDAIAWLQARDHRLGSALHQRVR